MAFRRPTSHYPRADFHSQGWIDVSNPGRRPAMIQFSCVACVDMATFAELEACRHTKYPRYSFSYFYDLFKIIMSLRSTHSHMLKAKNHSTMA